MKYRFKIESQSGVKRVGYEQSIATSHEFKTTCTFTTVGAEKSRDGACASTTPSAASPSATT